MSEGEEEINSPEALRAACDKIRALRDDLQNRATAEGVLTMLAELQLSSAVTYLAQAEIALMMAETHQAQALGGRR